MSGFSSDPLPQDYTVKIGNYFGRGWAIFKEYAWAFVVFTLVSVAIAVLTSLLPFPLGRNEDGQGGLVNAIISPILAAGYYIVGFQIARNRPKSFGDFFRGFNKFLQLLLVNIVGSILIAIGLILLIIPGLYLAIAYIFSVSFVVEKNLGFWQALETSRKVITKKWFSFFLLALALLALNIGGAILLGVGLLVTIPLSTCIIVAAYEDIIGLNSVADSGL